MGLLAKLFFGEGGGTDKDIDIANLINNDALAIDVRTTQEFAGGHIKGAINIPANAICQLLPNHETDKTRTLIVYCHSGARSASARRALNADGYTNVVNGGSLHRMRKQLEQ